MARPSCRCCPPRTTSALTTMTRAPIPAEWARTHRCRGWARAMCSASSTRYVPRLPRKWCAVVPPIPACSMLGWLGAKRARRWWNLTAALVTQRPKRCSHFLSPRWRRRSTPPPPAHWQNSSRCSGKMAMPSPWSWRQRDTPPRPARAMPLRARASRIQSACCTPARNAPMGYSRAMVAACSTCWARATR